MRAGLHLDNKAFLLLMATPQQSPKHKPRRNTRAYRARDAMTPLDKLACLPDAASFLRVGTPLKELQKLSDVQAAWPKISPALGCFTRSASSAITEARPH